MMGLSDGRKKIQIGLAVLIQYRSVTASHPASHVAVAITINAKASSLKKAYFEDHQVDFKSKVDWFITKSSRVGLGSSSRFQVDFKSSRIGGLKSLPYVR